MRLFTIGFTKKTAEQFFELIKAHGVRAVGDVRLNNASQLAGFTKGGDLAYFLRAICGAGYVSLPVFAPTKELLEGYREKKFGWQEYERLYHRLLASRRAAGEMNALDELDVENLCLLCSEETPDRCHRRLAAEYLRDSRPGQALEIVHL